MFKGGIYPMEKFKKLVSLALAFCVLCGLAVTSSTTASAEFTQSSYAFSQNMTIGYNIGNSLDSVLTSTTDETYWGNPKITQGLIQTVKNKGFNVIRIPVTWGFKIDSTGNFKDNRVLANRVKEVVGWAYDTGAYVILNTHHEMMWLNTFASIKNSNDEIDQTKLNAMLNKYGGLWTNIANDYKSYGERLIFEGYNETRSAEGTWTSITDDQVVLQKIGQKFIDSVRATGGNNAKRYLLTNTFGAGFSLNEINNYRIPTDSANHLLLGVHTYDPHALCFRDGEGGTTSVFNQSSFNSYYNKMMPAIESKFLSKGYGVILGEFGAVNKDNDTDRINYAKAVVTSCSKYGVIPLWWDSGVINRNSSKDAFGLVNRRAPYEWTKDNIATAMVSLANQLAPSRPTRGEVITPPITQPTQPTSTTTTKNPGQTTTVVFTDWTGTIAHVKTEGWGTHSTNLTSMPNAVTRSNGMLYMNTNGYTFDSQLVQVEMGLDSAQVARAIAAAKTTDGYLSITIKLNSMSVPTGTSTSCNFRIYCFKGTDWQNSIDIVGANDATLTVGNSTTVRFHIDNLEGMVPDTIAVNVMNEYYNDGITGVSYEMSSITAQQSGGSTPTNPPASSTTTTKSTTKPSTPTNPPQPSSSRVIDWEDGSLAKVSTSNSVISTAISSTMTAENSTKALMVTTSNWDEKTGNNYAKVNFSSSDTANIRDIKVNLGASFTGNAPHWGVIMNGTVYWDQAYMGGTIGKTMTEVAIRGKKFVSLSNGSFTSNGAYGTQVTITSQNLGNITGIAICPTNNSSVQKVYVDDITFVDANDIPTVTMPEVGTIFCDWSGTITNIKSEGWNSHITNVNPMTTAFTKTSDGMTFNTKDYTFDSLQVLAELTMDSIQAQRAISAAKNDDGYVYFKVRFNSARSGNGADCGIKFKVYCFANGNWQNAVELVGVNDTVTSEAGETLYKFYVDNLEGMVPDTIAILAMNEIYYNGISALNIDVSNIYAKGKANPDQSFTAASTTTTTTTQPEVSEDGYVSTGVYMPATIAVWEGGSPEEVDGGGVKSVANGKLTTTWTRDAWQYQNYSWGKADSSVVTSDVVGIRFKLTVNSVGKTNVPLRVKFVLKEDWPEAWKSCIKPITAAIGTEAEYVLLLSDFGISATELAGMDHQQVRVEAQDGSTTLGGCSFTIGNVEAIKEGVVPPASSTTTTVKTTTTTTTKTNPKPTTTTTAGPASNAGDINGDGKTNVMDLLIMKKIIGSPDGEYAMQYKDVADVNKDNRINVADLVIIKKLVASL